MSTLFITSDQHFKDKNIWSYKDETGGRIRPWASDMAQGDEMMLEAWNSVVGLRDTVLHLGDLVIHRSGFDLLGRLNGDIILVRGNHDKFKLQDYLPFVTDIRGTHKVDTVLLSHYPVHPDTLPSWCRGCIHGHIHEKKVLMSDGEPDPRYRNMSVEVAGITPLPFEAVRDSLR